MHHTLRRLSSLASMRYCVVLAVVRAEKPMQLGGTYLRSVLFVWLRLLVKFESQAWA